MRVATARRVLILALLQIAHFRRRNCSPGVPEWYETRRKTTHVVFWA